MTIKMQVKTVLLLTALTVLTATMPVWANTNEDEARIFFNQVLQNSQNPVIVGLARENLHKLRHDAMVSRTVEVPLLSQASGSLAVPIMANNNTMATFLVDTGATYTVITPRMAKKLGITVTPDVQRIMILTANGPIRVPKVVIPKLSVGGLVVHNVEAIVQNLGPDPILAGLLGVNFFKDVELTVKTDRLVLTTNHG
jgi:clan AA aspartic protease (TIGR02281 family)